MKLHILLAGSIIACCGIFGFTQILQRAQSLLSPEQILALVAQNRSSWVQFFLPITPILAAYLLLPVFPNHQALLAVPALILAGAVIGLQFMAATKRTKALNLPDAFIAARRKANATLAGCFIVAICFYAFALSL